LRTPVARREGRGQPVDRDIGSAGSQYLRRSDVRPTRLDRHVEPGLAIEPLGLGDEIAGELRVGQPFQLQHQRIASVCRGRRGKAQCGRRRPQPSVHDFPRRQFERGSMDPGLRRDDN